MGILAEIKKKTKHKNTYDDKWMFPIQDLKSIQWAETVIDFIHIMLHIRDP